MKDLRKGSILFKFILEIIKEGINLISKREHLTISPVTRIIMRKYIEEPSSHQGSNNQGHQDFQEGKTKRKRKGLTVKPALSLLVQNIWPHRGLILALFFFFGLGISWAFDYQEAVEKNLFSPERRYEPYLPEQEGTGGIKRELLKRGLILRGTFDNGHKRLAVIEVTPLARRELHLEREKKTLVLGEGESLGDCKVIEILSEKVILGGYCQGLTLSLQESPERTSPPPKKKVVPKPPKRPKKIPVIHRRK